MAKAVGIGIFLIVSAAYQANCQTVNCTQTGAGRFADPVDTTCQNYTYCVYNAATDTYASYNYVCPTTSVFNPATSVCTAPTNYVCTITTPIPTTTSIPTTTVAADPCTADGFVADPNSVDCSSYIQCVQINGVFTETTLTCPTGTYYDPTTTFCESNYVCTSATTTTAATTVTTELTTTAPPFSCTAVGRFANPSDTTCQTYYYCVASTTTTFTQYLYTCPTTSVFSPTSRVCTANYVCPTS